MIKVRYRSGDIIALALKPDVNAGMVAEDQVSETHVKIFRVNQPAPEYLRLEDIVPWRRQEYEHEPF